MNSGRACGNREIVREGFVSWNRSEWKQIYASLNSESAGLVYGARRARLGFVPMKYGLARDASVVPPVPFYPVNSKRASSAWFRE